MDAKSKSVIQEDLVGLYLRLNGFFVTGLIIHSPIHGQNLTEVDLLAVRFPNSCEPEREISHDPALELSSTMVDLVICEVKSKGKSLQFNDALLVNNDRIISTLRWAGIFKEPEILDLASKIRDVLQPANPAKTLFSCVEGPRQTRVRGILFSPERNSKRNNQPHFVSGPEIMKYISDCLCPPDNRQTCATTYDFDLWGKYSSIVKYFKQQDHGSYGNLDDLYKNLLNNN